MVVEDGEVAVRIPDGDQVHHQVGPQVDPPEVLAGELAAVAVTADGESFNHPAEAAAVVGELLLPTPDGEQFLPAQMLGHHLTLAGNPVDLAQVLGPRPMAMGGNQVLPVPDGNNKPQVVGPQRLHPDGNRVAVLQAVGLQQLRPDGNRVVAQAVGNRVDPAQDGNLAHHQHHGLLRAHLPAAAVDGAGSNHLWFRNLFNYLISCSA